MIPGSGELHEIEIKEFYKNVLKQGLFSIFLRKFSQKLPSVSKIIQATMPPEQRAILDRWEANKIAELGKLNFLIIQVILKEVDVILSI